jgi:hypothetical protein
MFHEAVLSEGIYIVPQTHDMLLFPCVGKIDEYIRPLNLKAPLKEVEILASVSIQLIPEFPINLLFR